MNEVVVKLPQRPDLIDRLIEHYQTCADECVSWGYADCAAGMLTKWDAMDGGSELSQYSGVRGLQATFNIEYETAVTLFYAHRADKRNDGTISGRSVLLGNIDEVDDRRAVIVHALRTFKETGTPHWAYPEGHPQA